MSNFSHPIPLMGIPVWAQRAVPHPPTAHHRISGYHQIAAKPILTQHPAIYPGLDKLHILFRSFRAFIQDYFNRVPKDCKIPDSPVKTRQSISANFIAFNTSHAAARLYTSGVTFPSRPCTLSGGRDENLQSTLASSDHHGNLYRHSRGLRNLNHWRARCGSHL